MAARVTRGRLWGVAGSVAAHLVLLAIALWSLRTLAPPPEPQGVQVQLVPPFRPLVRPSARRKLRSAVPAPAAPSPPPARAGAALPSPPAPSAEEDAAGAARATLRAALGCAHADFLNLSAEERQRCREKAAGNPEDAATLALNLDPRGLYYRDPNAEPYLIRKPKNGCKIRAAGDRVPDGRQGVASGITCGKTF
jgi:hypothetical protein